MNALLLLQQVCTVIVQWGTHWLEELFCSALGELLYPPRHGSYGGFEQRLLCTLQPQPSFSPCNTAGMLTTRLPCHVHCWQRLSPPVGLHFLSLGETLLDSGRRCSIALVCDQQLGQRGRRMFLSAVRAALRSLHSSFPSFEVCRGLGDQDAPSYWPVVDQLCKQLLAVKVQQQRQPCDVGSVALL